ncbi:Hpt domain-containing protein [Ramlibacter sp.]|uniref:Hpt domain-containing protein n=1 Tax=Ramlibacter sp. TaxID=1917967 RepID=UPI003D0F013D
MHEGMMRLLDALPAASRGRMVAIYRQSLGDQAARLRDAFFGGRLDEATSIAHKIAGSAAMMQDAGLAVSTRSLEQCLRGGRWDEAMEHWPEVEARTASTLAALAG